MFVTFCTVLAVLFTHPSVDQSASPLTLTKPVSRATQEWEVATFRASILTREFKQACDALQTAIDQQQPTTLKRLECARLNDQVQEAWQNVFEKEIVVLRERLEPVFGFKFQRYNNFTLQLQLESRLPNRVRSDSEFPAGYHTLWWWFLDDPACLDYFREVSRAAGSRLILMSIIKVEGGTETFDKISLQRLHSLTYHYVGFTAMCEYPGYILIYAKRFESGKPVEMTKIIKMPEEDPNNPVRTKFYPWKDEDWNKFCCYDAKTKRTQYCPVQIDPMDRQLSPTIFVPQGRERNP